MKKLLLLSLSAILISSLAFGQSGNTQFTTVLNTPAPNSTIQVGQSFPFDVTITVNTGNIVPADTVIIAVGNDVLDIRTGLTKNVNDTLRFNTMLTLTSATATTTNICALAYLATISNNAASLAPKFDTTGQNFVSCNSVNIQFATGTETIFVETSKIKEQAVSVYPNPATGNTINLDYVAQNTTEAVVNIYDLTGRKVLTHSYGKAFKGQENFSVDISGINKGMYILEIRQDGIKATGQFIK